MACLRRLRTILIVLTLPVFLPHLVGAASDDAVCDGVVCRWSLPTFVPLAEEGWTAHVGEVLPETHVADGLSLEVRNASRGGTFFLLSSAIPVTGRGSFSVELRSAGDLSRFAVLLREESPPGEAPADTVLFHAPTEEWALLSAAWEPQRPETTHVRVLLRGELDAGGSAAILFREPYFGPDRTTWRLDDEETPIAFGPRALHRFDLPGEHVVTAMRGSRDVASFDVVIPRVPPKVELALVPSPFIVGGARVRASVESPFHPSLIRNGDFSDGASGWALTTHELGPHVTLAPRDGRLTMSVSDAPHDGSFWLSQRVAVRPGTLYELTWDGRDDLGILRYGVRVHDGERVHEFHSPPLGDAGGGGSWRFRPTEPLVEVQLRALALAGARTSVEFDNVVLRRALEYRWSIGGAPTPRSDLHYLDVRVGDLVGRSVSLTVVDASGEGARAHIDAPAEGVLTPPSVRLRREPPLAVAGAPSVIDASPSFASWNAFGWRDPWATWSVEDEEAPGAAVLHAAGNLARLQSPDPPSTFGAGLWRPVRLPSAGATYDFVVQYRTTGPMKVGQILAREHAPDGSIVREANLTLSPATEWTRASLGVWSSVPVNHTLFVGVRGVFKVDGPSQIEFRDPVLIPTLGFGWDFFGPTTYEGSVVHVPPLAPGAHPFRVVVRTPGGIQAERHDVVRVVEMPPPFATLTGGVAADWRHVGLPAGVTVRLEGPESAEAPADALRAETERFAPGRYRVFAVFPEGDPLLLAAATIADRAGLAAAPLAAGAARGGTLPLEVRLTNPDLGRAEVILESPFGLLHRVPLAETADRAWSGAWRVPLWAGPGAYEARLRLVDAESNVEEIPWGAVHVSVAPGAPGGAGWLILALGVAVATVWLPRGGRRP